jgi:hypothetical protein
VQFIALRCRRGRHSIKLFKNILFLFGRPGFGEQQQVCGRFALLKSEGHVFLACLIFNLSTFA